MSILGPKVKVETNGSITEDALILGRMSERGIIVAELAMDEFHDKIDKRVERRFKRGLSKNKYGWWSVDCFENKRIRTVTNPCMGGRCVDGSNKCPRKGFHILANGDFKSYGCPDAPVIGNLKTGFKDISDVNIQSLFNFNFCHKDVNLNVLSDNH